jgi:CheY-like chemotaxis protein
MTGLLIEDDSAKANNIIAIINENFPAVKMDAEMSYQSGINQIFDKEYDFILLDMSLPSYDQVKGNFSGKPKGFGGSDILKEMRRYGKKSTVMVITQYNEFDGGLISMADLNDTLHKTYSELYQGYIVYNARRNDWKDSLISFLKTVVK